MSLTTSTLAATVSNPTHDSAALTPAQRQLALLKFSGEVMGTFNRNVVIKNFIRTKTIKGGKGYQFPAIGKVEADYHQPGERLLGQAVNHGTTTINIDDVLLTTVQVSEFEEMLLDWEVRGEYSRQMGEALAQRFDRKGLAMALKACYDGATGPIAEMGAAAKIDIGLTPTPADFIAGVFAAQQDLDENDIPSGDRVLIVTPQTYYSLVQDGSILNQDYGNDGNGSQASGQVLKVAGLPIVVSNNLALNHVNAVERAGSVLTDFDADARTARGLILQRQALGCVELMGVKTESEYLIETQSTLMVAKMANGMGVLRPECLRLIDAA